MNRGCSAWPVFLWCIGLSCPASAQRLAIDLSPGPLGVAIERLATQTNLSIATDDPALLRRVVKGVRGRMTAATALHALARQADARVQRIGSLNWRLLARGPGVRRPPVTRSASPSPAPQADHGEDIIVRASKRETPYHALAGSIEVIANPSIAIEAGTAAIVARSTIISSTYRGAGREKLFIRGIADSSFSGRLQSVTGLYLGEVRLTYSASDPDLQLYDMDSVEVLQGPQGTLYGSGSMAGIIRLNARMPERSVTRGTIGGGISTVKHGAGGGDADGMANLSVTDDLAVRMVAYSRSEGGFIDKPAIGRRDANRTTIDGGRVAARWWPAKGWTVDAIAVGQVIRNRDSQYATIGAPPLTDRGEIAEPSRSDYGAAHLVVRGRLGGLSVVSATGVTAQRFEERFWAPIEGGAVGLRRRHDFVTHETRLVRSGEDGTGWVAGLAHTRARGASDFSIDVPTFSGMLGVKDTVSETAVFGEGTVRVVPFLSVGAGARAVSTVSRTSSTISYAPDYAVAGRRRRERWLLPTASVLLRPGRRVSAYIRYQQGRRPTATSPVTITSDSPANERVDVIDAGMRWSSENEWRASVSVEHSRWRTLQYDIFEGYLAFFQGGGSTWRIVSVNAAVDGPLGAGVTVDASVTANDLRLIDLPFEGARSSLPDVAGVIGRIGLNWTHAVGRDAVLLVNGWSRYEGASPAVIGPFLVGRQGDYVRTAFSVALDRKATRWSLSIDNVFDARGTRYALGSLFRAGDIATPMTPRTFIIGVQRRF